MSTRPASTERFSIRADDYRAARPSYPTATIDAMLAGLGSPNALAAADLGAGTGIMTRLLAERGVRVFAVEPNAAMRDAGVRHTRGSRAQWIDATAESTTLPTASVGLVVAAQAYHWFDHARACAEAGRVLRPHGRLALVWNEGDQASPLVAGYYTLVRAASLEAMSSYEAQARAPTALAPFDAAAARSHVARHAHELTSDMLVARARSASYVPASGPEWHRLEAQLRDLHARHADQQGRAQFWYRSLLWTFDLP